MPLHKWKWNVNCQLSVPQSGTTVFLAVVHTKVKIRFFSSISFLFPFFLSVHTLSLSLTHTHTLFLSLSLSLSLSLFLFSTRSVPTDCGPGCCCNFYCCSMCVWANAVSLSGMEPFGIASPDTLCWATIGIHCCTSYCCGPCLWSYEMRQQLTKNLGIDETPMCSAAQAVCCTGCSIMQMTHEIMTRKNLKFGCCGSVEVDQNAPTAGVDVVVNVKA